jgi:hypothetical protein
MAAVFLLYFSLTLRSVIHYYFGPYPHLGM